MHDGSLSLLHSHIPAHSYSLSHSPFMCVLVRTAVYIACYHCCCCCSVLAVSYVAVCVLCCVFRFYHIRIFGFRLTRYIHIDIYCVQCVYDYDITYERRMHIRSAAGVDILCPCVFRINAFVHVFRSLLFFYLSLFSYSYTTIWLPIFRIETTILCLYFFHTVYASSVALHCS